MQHGRNEVVGACLAYFVEKPTPDRTGTTASCFYMLLTMVVMWLEEGFVSSGEILRRRSPHRRTTS